MTDERCNVCGGAFVEREGVISMFVCEDCGRETPRRAFVDVDHRFGSDELGLLHQITGGDFRRQTPLLPAPPLLLPRP